MMQYYTWKRFNGVFYLLYHNHIITISNYISDLYKVINIDANHVAEYTRRFLPQEWKDTRTGLVTWDTSSSQHPPLKWIQEFWVFLNSHFKELSRFTGIPLIPVGNLAVSHNVPLAPLQTNYIFQTNKDAKLPDQIATLVNKAGGTVVKENIWLKHTDLDSYVLQPSPVNVLKVLVNLECQRLITELKATSHSVRDELKEYLSCLKSLSSCEKNLLSKLPLFQTMKGQCSAVQSKQAVLLISDFKVPAELPLPDSIVQCATEADRRLLQLLDIKLLSTAEAANLLIDCIEKGSCSKDDTEKIMTWILQHGSMLFPQNMALKDRCKNLSFIEVKGQQKKVSCFFDPRIHTFTVIFESDLFPPHKYTQTSQMLESLTDLGLMNKEADVSPVAFLHAATLIDKMHLASPTEAQKRAQVLLKMLDVTDLLSKFTHEQLQQLKKLKWVPCNKPDEEKSQRSFFCPNETRDSMYKDIVGRVMPLVENLSDRVSTKLGFKCSPPPDKVIENLLALASKTRQMGDPDKNACFKKELHSIYRHMQDYMSEFKSRINTDICWIWSHDQFVSAKDLFLDYPRNLDLSLYIRKVSNEFLPYKELLQASGLKTLNSDEEIIAILYSIQQNIMEQQSTASSSEVKVSVDILNWFWKERKAVGDDIPVPVILEGGQYTLKPKSTTVFCDLSKSALKEFGCNQEEVYIIHEEIPKATAEWLNIQFLSTYILDPELVGIEQCGQSEPITTRIKNILKEYDEDSDIFKELIQNAEDAGADVCKFLVDFRVHRDAPESLIDPNMALCQGPCLWAFNNEQFWDEDWKNIIRVGSASKENQVEKIGKFGLGFNTVYHVTDIPSILSGSSLLILDPNVSHLKKHIKHKTNPGIKLDLSQQRHFKCFPGQFGPYEGIFDFSKQKPVGPYPGTLIKLPFRTAEEAAQSEISQKVYDKYNITRFQQQFTEYSQTHLLFLKKISTLTLQTISNTGSTPPRDDEIDTVFTISKRTLSTTRVTEETCVTKQCEAERMLTNHDEKSKIIDCCTVNIIQITSQHCGKTEVQHWLQYNCYGLDSALKMALQENQNTKFSLPIGGVAVPLQKNPQTEKLRSSQTHLVGQAFCFLPLSICTGLPVNVNGTFAVTSNRKALWESGMKHEWNKALLQDPIMTAYLTTLLTLKKMSQDKQLEEYTYHTFWPDREEVSETFKPLVDAFYSAIAKNSVGPELFSDGEHWCTMENAIFLHESIKENKDIHALAEDICKKYVTKPKRVVPLPLWLRNNFKQARLEHVLQDRTWNWEKLFKEVVFNNLATIDPTTRDSLVLHAIDLNTEEIDNLLVNFPCIPTTGGNLQYINQLVNPSGKVACLFEPHEGRLLGGSKNDFSSPKRIQRLLELGMASDYLPLKDITEKAGTICQTWRTDREKANEQIKCLLELIKHHMYDIDSNYWETLKMTEFLPAISPDDNKEKPVVTLKRPTDVFTDNCNLLVNLIHPVLDHEKLKIHNTDSVLKILGTHDTPSPETVLQQLQGAYRQSKSIDKSMLHRIAFECYKFLDQWLIDNEDPSDVLEKAKSFPFILIGSTFANVTCVAKSEQFEAKPYLHVLPDAFKRFEKLWESVGVAEKYTVSQCVSVLEELHSQYGTKSLAQHDLSMCLTILNKGIFEAEEKTNDCPIPNEHGVLQPASAMFYNDSPWMPVDAGVTLCHKNVSRAMARHFGVETTRHHSLQIHIAEDIAPFAFPFEQHEELTVRIKNIISAYPSKKDILKELIQNADDAEATEIHFVWDKRQHGKEKTFGKKWNQLQGPALCVFNNKVFSDVDLAGIQQLGEGGKHNSLGKTGKYGVGFNSVYHLTDCPSILTGDDLLCIFDPNQKYIESSSGKPPAGIGYNLSDNLKAMYEDVYSSFLPNKFPLRNGTMFRLPLRAGNMANSSKISNESVTDEYMKKLCSVLSKDPEGLILFLKNICKIVVHEINQESGQMETIFMVEKSVTQTSRDKKDTFVKLQQKALTSAKVAKPQKVIYETTISTSGRLKSQWLIAEQFGSFAKTKGNVTTFDQLPQAAIAASMNSSTLEFKGEAFCSLPLPGKTGLPVHINANFEVDSSRKNLWKEDGQSLKTKWNELLKETVVAPLYADLLHHISLSVAKTKVQTTFIESCFKHTYLCFWPVASKDVDQDWHEMIHKVYRSIKERGLTVIPVKKTSVRNVHKSFIKEYSFDWCDIRETGRTNALYLAEPFTFEIGQILEELGMKLVPFSDKMQEIWRSFNNAGVELKMVNSSTVRSFLKEKPLNDPTQTSETLPLPLPSTLIRDENRCSLLLKYCLKDLISAKVTEENSDILDGLPLLLTRDKVLRVFNSKSPKVITRHDSLFLDDMEQFADFTVNRENRETLQKYNLVKNLTVPCAANYLKPLIQRHLQSCEVDSHSGFYVPNETMSKWLKSLWKFLESEIKQEINSDDNETLKFSDVKELFSDCFILPVECPQLKNNYLLQRMKDMSSVIQFASDRDISSVLFKLGFMKLHNRFFTETHVNQQLTLLLKPELMDVNDSSIVLDQICNKNNLEFSNLSNHEKSELQTFLQSGVAKAKNKQDFQRKLKSLPLFETISGDRVRIDGPLKVFVLQSQHLMSYPDLLKLPKCNSIFLKDTLDNCSLSESLKIPKLTDDEYFTTFILPAIHELTGEQKLDCFRFLLSLRRHLIGLSYMEKIIPTLKTVKWICSSQGKLEMASYFFDKRVPLYEKMLPKEMFVPEGFFNLFGEESQDKIEMLLKELGMKHEVSKNDIIKFAHQLESEAKRSGHLQDLKDKSLLIFKAALAKASDPNNKDKTVLESIADINFLFPVRIRKELCDYHKPFADQSTAVKIRGSLIDNDPKDQDLIWSSMPIIKLPVGMFYNLLQMMKNAGAHEKPPAEYVVANMRNICVSPCKSSELIKTRAQVFRCSYMHLQGQGFKAKTLTGLPVVLVENDKELVKDQDTVLVLRYAQEFRPYLYEIHSKDVIFKDFFMKLGVKENPTAAHYCRVLESVYNETCEKQQLQANQLRTVKRAIHQLFYTIKEQKKQAHLNGVTSLHLLGVDGKLHPSSTLYYNDTVFEAQRLEPALGEKFLLLEKFINCHLGPDTYKHHRWLSLLPTSFQPKMLSQVTEEKLVEEKIQQCELKHECEFRGWFDEHLSSLSFRHGLICLIRSHSGGEIQHEDAAMLCQKNYGSMKIVCCKNLETMLWLNKEPLQNTASDSEICVKQGQHGCIFYLKHNDGIPHKVISEVNMTLAKEIIALSDNKISLHHFAALEQLLLCDTLQDVQKILAKNKIRDSAEGKSLLEPPAPGTEVPKEWHDWLDMDILNNFEVDEYVGYRDETEKYIYAVIVEELQGNTGQYSHRYKVNVGGDEPIEVSCIDLYQFKREKKTEDEGTSTPPQNHCKELQLLEKAGPNPSSSSSTSGSSSTRSMPASFDEIKREIDRCLAEIWTLSQEQRRKAIRRLYLRFHPDKNSGSEFLATEACQYLQTRVKELSSEGGPCRSSSSSRAGPNFNTFYEQWNREARSHKQSRERNSSHSWTHNENIPKPNKKEAQRWCQQARCDLKAAYKDTDGDSTEWCLFKVHQAVEKSLVAAGYKRDGHHHNSSCSISMLAAQVSNYSTQLKVVSQIVQELKLMGVDAKRTQYPSCYRYPNIPNGQFPTENEISAINKASELLSIIEEYVS